jgi:glutathione reductase (NADPH)
LIRFKRTFTEPFPKDREDSYGKDGIIPFHGPARFVGSNTVKVGYDGNNSILDGRFILIATGASANNL